MIVAFTQKSKRLRYWIIYFSDRRSSSLQPLLVAYFWWPLKLQSTESLNRTMA